jgi:hypothetical protein
LAAAAIFARAAGLMRRRLEDLAGFAPLLLLTFAHLAFCAAAILARALALMVRLPFVA